jgi:GNAT superfamily N-acetyltransferase
VTKPESSVVGDPSPGVLDSQLPPSPPPDVTRRRLLIRTMRPTDADSLRAFHARLSAESVYLRYFSPHPNLSDEDVRRFTCVDGTDRLAVVAFDGICLVGVARADRLGMTDRAEVAVIVTDDLQRCGVGTALLERLVRDSRRVGIHFFEADTLLSNQRMLDVFRHLGFPVASHLDCGVIHVTFPITPTADYERACQNRRTALTFDDEPP